ncbi:MAG TPA: PD-(D/E)XK nuclease family protein [Thermoanaerobaculia bacterium]|nr:PD-(D/E)XK nuclease family protein [Thermoanaerobaculia bacterium]
MKLRCSSLPLAFRCPGSLRQDPGELRIEIAHEAGALGSAVHAVLAEMVLNQNGEYPDVRLFALKYGVDADDLGRLVSYGSHAWRAVRDYYPNPSTEEHLAYETPSFALSGHLDVVALGSDWANFLDWKSGYKQPDYYAQLMGYATLLVASHPSVRQVKASIVWLRDWSQETVLITADDVLAWEDELTARIVRWDGRYTAGDHCQYCPRFATCPARQALVRSAITELREDVPAVLEAAPDGIIRPLFAALYTSGKLQLAKQILKRIDDLIRQDIAVHGALPLGNGRELALVGEPRDTIQPLPAWPILSGYLTQEELAGCVKIGKTALLDAIGDKAPKGKKAKTKDQVMAELKAAEAVTTETTYKLRERKEEPHASP